MIEPTERPKLPIGLDWEGTRYRDVVIDTGGMSGIDEENLSDKSVRNNGARAITRLLQRIIVEIPGLTKPKNDPYRDLIDEKYIRGMYAGDRDFLLVLTFIVGNDPEFEMPYACPSCGDEGVDRIDLRDLEVYDWDEEGEPIYDLVMPDGFLSKDKSGKETRHCNVKWKTLKGYDMEKIIKMPSGGRQSTAIISAALTEVEGMARPGSEQVRRLSTRDRQFLLEASNEYQPGVELRTNVVCDACSNEWLAPVNLSRFFNKGSAVIQNTTKSGKNGRKRRKRR